MEEYEDEFWEQVDKQARGCWLWRGSANGVLKFGGQKDMRVATAAWVYTMGPVPHGTTIIHRCGNHLCCRPDHLEAVTPAERMRRLDAMRCRDKGQKLTADDVRDIRRRVAAGELQKTLVEEYGVDKGLISHIVSRKRWGHVQ